MLHRDTENIHSQTNLRQHKRLLPSAPFLCAWIGVHSEPLAHYPGEATLGFCRPVYFESTLSRENGSPVPSWKEIEV